MQHCYDLLFITGTVVASRIDALGAKARLWLPHLKFPSAFLKCI
jgi:hypothetical protein